MGIFVFVAIYRQRYGDVRFKQRDTKEIKYYELVVREILISVSLFDLEHKNVMK